jgi:hypothetical protein
MARIGILIFFELVVQFHMIESFLELQRDLKNCGVLFASLYQIRFDFFGDGYLAIAMIIPGS